jgi:hypothetical protein
MTDETSKITSNGRPIIKVAAHVLLLLDDLTSNSQEPTINNKPNNKSGCVSSKSRKERSFLTDDDQLCENDVDVYHLLVVVLLDGRSVSRYEDC